MDDIPEELLAATYRFARRLTGNAHAAEDLAHDVFVRVWARWLRPREPAALRVYLFRATVRRWSDLRRRKPMSAVAVEPAGHEPSPARHAAGREELAEVLAKLDELPEQQRLAVHLVAVEGLSLGEAAATLGSTPNAVKANLSVARSKLRAWDATRNGDG